MFQVDHGYVKREKKFSLEQCVFIPLPKERGISDSALSHSSYSTQNAHYGIIVYFYFLKPVGFIKGYGSRCYSLPTIGKLSNSL